MLDWISAIFETDGFPPRWECGTGWADAPFWGWLHILADLGTFTAYVCIPLVFIYFLKRRPDLPMTRVWWLFATFIFACGTVHLLEAIIFWVPVYRLSAVIKLVTAIASWATLLSLLPMLPIVLTLRSPTQLEKEVRERTAEVRAAHRRIQENDERLRLALLAGRMGTWSWNLEPNTMELDATEIELTGLGKRSGTITAEQYFERVHRDDREALDRALREAIDGLEHFNHLFRLYIPERGYRWLQARGSVIGSPGGKAERMVGVNFDVTDQMADQEALRVRTRAIEFATNGIVITDARTSGNPIIYVNPAFQVLTGYLLDQVIGKNCRFLQGPETDPTAVDELRQAIRNQVECEVTILNYRRDGQPFWNHLQIAPVTNDDGLVTHFIGLQTDITDRVANERRLLEAQIVAESANRAKSEFLANMSHEIRTPLTAILGCADSLCRELSGEAPRATAKTIRSQGQLLMGILNDVLDLSKIEAGKLEIHKEPCSIMATIADVRSLMDPQASAKGLELITCFDTALPEVIHTDPLRFRQVLINLTSNAIKFTERGRVELRIQADSENSLLQVSVVDTGIGIPAERLRAIFDAFTQVDDSIVRRVGGTGLGLTICQRLVQMLGGELTVVSQLHEGSMFRFSIPFGMEGEQSLFTVDELTERRSQKESNESLDVRIPARILIAEDTKAIQFMLKRMLEPIVDEIVVVNHGAEALEALDAADPDANPFALVLMDMQMPVMNGYDATAEIRARGYQLPVIALTAGAMAGDRERCLEVGCSDYLAKPIDRGALLAMMVTYCNQGLRKPP
ncbi:ATP-binding protein [Planctomicrobium sp. SH664]|uniref:hybrid sensor histidine kinase/response regulator n=1 Tax=Planctomicrobium sp. SH664 TaxID=3448125 RepID=UPI003F5C2295